MISRYEKLSSSLSEIGRLIQRLSDRVMKDYGLRGALAKYLLVLRRYKTGVTASRLSTLCERNKADVSRALGELEELGLVRRLSGVSYRAKISLSDKGMEIADSLAIRAGEVIAYVGKDISEEERTIFYHSLESIAKNLEAIDDGALDI